jgi:hypothetical protein
MMDEPAPMDDRRFQLAPSRGQSFSSDCTADLSDDYNFPSLRELLARPKQVIDLTLDDNNDKDDDIIEISRLSIILMARYYISLTPLSLTDRFPIID